MGKTKTIMTKDQINLAVQLFGIEPKEALDIIKKIENDEQNGEEKEWKEYFWWLQFLF